MNFRFLFAMATLSLSFAPAADAQVLHSFDAPKPECVERVKPDRKCSVQQIVLAVEHRDGVTAAMNRLELLGRDQAVERMGHAYAHAIGLAALSSGDDVGEVFASCTAAFHSGCYHGVMQAFFNARNVESVDAELLHDLCAGPRALPDSRWILYQCVHGIGHGLMLATHYDIDQSLAICQLLDGAWDQQTCFSAVFMENVVAATAGADPVGRPSSGHGAVGPDPDVAFRRDDLLYPCSRLGVEFLAACYQMQTSAILQLHDFDIPLAAGACGQAHPDFRSTCYQSLGRDIGGLSLQDYDNAIQLCTAVPAASLPQCYYGYAKYLIDVGGDPMVGLNFCRTVAGQESKRVCYTAVGEELWVLYTEDQPREVVCARAEDSWIADCRLGAGLTD